MDESKVTGITLEELSATAEWKSLGPNLKRLLTYALQTRNLLAAIHEVQPNLDAGLQRKIAEDILTMPAVRQVIDLYAVGISAQLLVVTSDHNSVAPSADAPDDVDKVSTDVERVN